MCGFVVLFGDYCVVVFVDRFWKYVVGDYVEEIVYCDVVCVE